MKREFMIVSLRGRGSCQPRRHEYSAYTADQLDAVAPHISHSDQYLLRMREPPPHVKRLIARRVAAARNLKTQHYRRYQ